MGTLWKALRWLAEKASISAAVIVVALAGTGLWLYLSDHIDFQEWRGELLRTLNGERENTREALADVHARLEQTTQQIAAAQSRVNQANRVIQELHNLESTWDRLIGNPDQQKANAEQIKRMETLRDTASAEVEKLQQEYRRTTWERDGLELALGKVETQLQAVERDRSRVLHYLDLAWQRAGSWVIALLAIYFLGPPAGRIALYFGFAPIAMRGRPVHLENELTALPEVTSSQVTADVTLRPGERLWVKERYLQASDEGLARKTRMLLDWRIPFTSLASGLVELIEMRHREGGGGRRVTLSHHDHPQTELAIVTLPEKAALVLRPSFLAGVILGEGRRLQVKRRWQIWRWQAWATLQFRYFEFRGPCRLVVAGSRGVRSEALETDAERPVAARRTNQDATIGFTPNLEYRPVRAETFWSYYRGMNPLFDDLFTGRGLFLCQQIAGGDEAKRARRFWSAVWGGMLRVFGL